MLHLAECRQNFWKRCASDSITCLARACPGRGVLVRQAPVRWVLVRQVPVQWVPARAVLVRQVLARQAPVAVSMLLSSCYLPRISTLIQ
jgi:hypothetical protein